MRTMKHWALAVMTAAALALAGCGGGGGGTSSIDPPPAPAPTAYETAKAAIAAATTADAAQAAYDAVKDDVTAAQGDMLQMAVNERQAALAMMARADAQKMALMDALGMIDTTDLSTQEAVDAARAAIVALRAAIAAAEDVDDTSMYEAQLASAEMAVDMAQGGIDTATRRMNQMDALSGASDTLQAALAALAGSTPTQAQLDAANNALAALNMAIADGTDLTDAEKATYVREAANAAAPITTAQMGFDDAEDEAERVANAAMAVTARKLYTGISAQMGAGDGSTFAPTDRDAFYNAAGTAILVSIGDGTATPTAVSATLAEDKKMSVADNHGWEGKRYTRTSPASGGAYEAVVYSNVEEPKMGRKFGSAAAVDTADATRSYEYQLNAADRAGNANKALTVVDATHAALISLTGVTRTAGTETFKLPEQTQEGEQFISVPGTFHGVSGIFSCAPASGERTCTADVAAKGFSLVGTSGEVWLFIPANAEARVRDAEDDAYASYGWWLHKNEAESLFTASAFVDEKGTVADATGLDALNGKATYMGGAAGKYALSSSTGGTNDAGHFTARATLEANFTNNTAETAITGTIDQFIGADGESRDWSVKLNGSQISDTGAIGNASASTEVETVWTIGERAGAASGNWTGNLRNNGSDGVPQVATGTFYSEYGHANNDGRMVGAFGANVQ